MEYWTEEERMIQVNRLLNKVDELTAGEIEELYNYHGKARGACFDVAHKAGLGKVQEKVREDVFERALARIYQVADSQLDGNECWRIAIIAADAACALFVRDYIETRTPWNQEAYNMLMNPWITIVGKTIVAGKNES